MLTQLILRFIAANRDEQFRLLKSFPVLFSEWGQGQVEEHAPEGHVLELLRLLKRCQKHGLQSEFPNFFGAETGSLPPAGVKVRIATGPFVCGSDSGNPLSGESPARTLVLDEYLIDKHPVTNAQYARFLLETGYPVSEKRSQLQASNSEGGAIDASTLEALQLLLADAGRRGFQHSRAQTHPNHPVTEVSWYDAVEYARWAGGQLPTAEQWEKAARGTTERNWSWGDESSEPLGNTMELGLRGTSAVTQFEDSPSVYGCCDLSGNVLEWTATPSKSEEWGKEAFVIKGGGWSLPVTEAQVWKRLSDPPGDLWNALGFRCCYRTVEEEANGNAIGAGGHDALRLLAELAASGETQESRIGTTAEVRHNSLTRESLRHLLSLLAECVRDAADQSLPELTAFAQVARQIAQAIDDPAIRAEAEYVLSVAALADSDVSRAIDGFESCVAYYRSQPDDEEKHAVALLSLGLAMLKRNLTYGDQPIDAKKAQQILVDAVSRFKLLNRPIDEQRALVGLADAHRLLGESSLAFQMCLMAMARSAWIAAPRHEAEGLLRVANVFLDIGAIPHAEYCMGRAHWVASSIADLRLIVGAKLGLFLASTVGDTAAAARVGAETFEALCLFEETDSLDRFLNVVFAQASHKPGGWTIASYLGNLMSVVSDPDQAAGLDSRLPLFNLSQGAIAYALRARDVLLNCVACLQPPTPGDSADAVGYLAHALRALAFCNSEPTRAFEESEMALACAIKTGRDGFVVNARQVRIEVSRKLCRWPQVVEDTALLKQQFLSSQNIQLALDYFGFAAQALFEAGDISAALDACDEASSVDISTLPLSMGARHHVTIHLLRSRIYSSLGFWKDMLESASAKTSCTSSADRLAMVSCLVREAEIWLSKAPPSELHADSLEAAGRNLHWAQSILNAGIGGRTDPNLQIEFLAAVGKYYLRAGSADQAMHPLEQALSNAQSLERVDLQVSLLCDLSEALLLKAQYAVATIRSAEALAAARRRNSPLELLDALIAFAKVRVRSGQIEEARAPLEEALELYKAVRETITGGQLLRKTWLKKNSHLFDMLVGDSLVGQGYIERALGVVQDMKAASMRELSDEADRITAFGGPTEEAEDLRLLWQEIRRREVALEKKSKVTSQEDYEYAARRELHVLRKDWQARFAVVVGGRQAEGTGDESALNDKRSAFATEGQSCTVEFVVTASRVIAFVVGTQGPPEVVVLEHLSHRQLRSEIADPFLDAYRARFSSAAQSSRAPSADRSRFLDALEALLRSLYTALFATPGSCGRTLLEVLRQQRARRLLLVPADILALLPIHASFSEVDNTRRYLLDEFAVSYAPSLQLVGQPSLAARRDPAQLLIVANPDSSLRYADYEGERVGQNFLQRRVLRHGDGTKAAVLDSLTHADLVHFACHATFNLGDPLSSGLLLSDQILSLADLYGTVRLNRRPVVTLAACESGLVDQEFLDEFLGLPAAFLQAGASAVVSTLWPVDDLSTALLMERYYVSLSGGMNVPDAVRDAQIWLRDSTPEQLQISDHQLRLAERGISFGSATSRRNGGRKRADGSYRHPYYWAAFTCNGV